MPKTQPPDITTERDALFAEGLAPTEFRFDEAVARVFPDMLRRSIPGYSTLLHLIGIHAQSALDREEARLAPIVYDLGCSLGAVSLTVRHALGARPARIIAIDNSPAMVEKCREIISADSALCPVDVELGDITRLSLLPCSLVVLNFTLQFCPPDERAQVMARIFESLLPGGSLVLSEKTKAQDGQKLDFYERSHDAFREQNGYSQLELSRKRQALENVLIPLSAEEYEHMMSGVGFVPVQWFRCLQFVSWVAHKPTTGSKGGARVDRRAR